MDQEWFTAERMAVLSEFHGTVPDYPWEEMVMKMTDEIIKLRRVAQWQNFI